ncbi:MAG: dTMP kinase [Pseudomonadota bacterium]
MRGRLICLEGGEGAGKSTAMRVVRETLEQAGRKTLSTREPGGTPAAEKIRHLLLSTETGDLDPISELLLMFAARRENVIQIIEPALAQGVDVICDRFTEASHAYQGGGRELGPEPVNQLASIVHPDLRPDLVLLLDVPVEVGLQRIQSRKDGPDRFESDRGEFLMRVRQTYLERAQQQDYFAVIDATVDQASVAEQIRRVIRERLA